MSDLEDLGGVESSPVLVEVDGVSKRYPRRRSLAQTLRHPRRSEFVQSLAGVSFHVREGEFFGLLGPNGAGKTTLLKVLATFIDADEGAVSICGHDIGEERAIVRTLVAPVVASERSLYWRLTVRQNLELFGTLWRVPAAELSDRVDEVLKVVGLTETGESLVGTFSSGMMQRLLIARALVARPRVLLLDEPTRSLDPVAARDFRAFLKEELGRVRGSAVIVATHSPDEAFGLCDRVAVLHAGRITATGVPSMMRRSFGGREYLLQTRTPTHPALAASVVRYEHNATAYPGVTAVVLEVAGNAEAASELLRRLIGEGVDVVSFSPLEGSLATLLEGALSASNRE